MAVRGEHGFSKLMKCNKGWRTLLVPLYLINSWLITDHHRYCTYTYYYYVCIVGDSVLQGGIGRGRIYYYYIYYYYTILLVLNRP